MGEKGLKKIRKIGLCFGSRPWWKYLSVDQKIAVGRDFSKITSKLNELQKKEVFGHLCSAESNIKPQAGSPLHTQARAISTTGISAPSHIFIPKLGYDEQGLKALYELSPYFIGQHWKNVSVDQAKRLDFSKIESNLRQKTFLEIFYTSNFQKIKDFPDNEVVNLARQWARMHIETPFTKYQAEQIQTAFLVNRSEGLAIVLKAIFTA